MRRCDDRVAIERTVSAQQHESGRGRGAQPADGGENVADELARPARGPGCAFAESGPDDDRCCRGRGNDPQQRVQPAHPGIPVTGTLLLVTVDFLDRVIDIHQGVLIDPGCDRRHSGEIDQPPPGDRVELADMTERERTQE